MISFAEPAPDFGPDTISTPISDEIAPRVPVNLPRTVGLSDQEPPWVKSVGLQLAEIVALKEGWDGFGAGPIRREVLYFAIMLQAKIMRVNTPAPHIAPMSHEGIQLEWHEKGIDLEIEIEAPGAVWVSYVDNIDSIDQSWALTTDFSSLSEPIAKLTERT